MMYNFRPLLAAFLIAAQASAWAQPLTENARMAQAAFEALSEARVSGDYAPAIAAGDACVARFSEAADDIQADLRARGEPVVSPRDVGATEEDQLAIHRRGPLNDVAACLFVKVAAEAAQRDVGAAAQAYSALCRYPHSLVWDPRGWFWNPAQGARTELRGMGLSPETCPE